VLVPCFLLFLCFRKVTQEIFSKLDETKASRPEFYRSFQRTEEELEWGYEGPTHQGGAAIDPKIGRVQKLFPAPCQRGKPPPEVFFIAMLASRAMSE
jgi:hypothetical protein